MACLWLDLRVVLCLRGASAATLFNYIASRCDSHADLSGTGAPKALYVTDPDIDHITGAATDSAL